MTDAAETPLWDELKQGLRVVAQVFGEPARLLENIVLPRREGLALAAWLAALEALARALLLMMAARLPKPAPSKARPRPARRPAARAAQATDDDGALADPPGSEAWAGIVFHAAAPARRGVRGRAAPPRRFITVRALAYRFEALIRVAEAPEAYARRLARRLHAAPALAARVLARPSGGPGRAPPWDDVVTDALSAAWTAAPAFSPDTG